MTETQAAGELAARVELPGAFDGASATLRLEVLRVAQLAGAADDPGHPAAPEEVVTRANTYWEWMTK